MRQLDQNAASRGIVIGAVVNVVTRHIGANAQMIVVRACTSLPRSFNFAIGTRQHGDHIVRFKRPDFADHVRLQLHRKRYRMEIGERASAIILSRSMPEAAASSLATSR